MQQQPQQAGIGQTIGTILGTAVGVANATSTLVGSLSNLAEGASTTSADWLKKVKRDSIAANIMATEESIETHSLTIAKRRANIKTLLEGNEDLKSEYDSIKAQLTAAFKTAGL